MTRRARYVIGNEGEPGLLEFVEDGNVHLAFYTTNPAPYRRLMQLWIAEKLRVTFFEEVLLRASAVYRRKFGEGPVHVPTQKRKRSARRDERDKREEADKAAGSVKSDKRLRKLLWHKRNPGLAQRMRENFAGMPPRATDGAASSE